jgi:ribosome maturation factor RimP
LYHTENERFLLQFKPKEEDPLFDAIETVVRGLGLSLIDISVSKYRGGLQIRVVVYKRGTVCTDDCSRVHRAIIPRLDLAFPNDDFSVEVSSPGIDRLIKNTSELVYYVGCGIKCYKTDTSDWTSGVLRSVDENGLVLEVKNGTETLQYDGIAKVKLDYSQI